MTIPEPRIMRDLYSSLGVTYSDIEEYSDAFFFFEKELELCENDHCTIEAVKCIREMVKNGKLGNVPQLRILHFIQRGLDLARDASHIPCQVQMLIEKRTFLSESGQMITDDCSDDSIAKLKNENFLSDDDIERLFDHEDEQEEEYIDLKVYCKEAQSELGKNRSRNKKLPIINNCGK